MNPPTTQDQMNVYLDQCSLLLRIMQSFVCARSVIEKYTELLSSLTLCLFSISPQEIAPFYQFILRHWPRGYSEKVSVFILIYLIGDWIDSVPGEFAVIISTSLPYPLFEGCCS